MSRCIAQGHIVGPTAYWLSSLLFHANPPSHSWGTAFLYLTFEFQGQGYGRGQSSKPQNVSHFLSIRIPFVPCKSVLWFPWYESFGIWHWKSKVNVISVHCFKTTGVDDSLRTSISLNPSSGLDICAPQSLDHSGTIFDKVLAHAQAHMWQIG